ncbi:hypothetical protein EYZ11_003166 [Aspergillus tanneri]|uniref:Uncharacterized protein n=1 Tax=Aspergillus tanneri TaxID=1220188 RepID=A0A4S3JP01_9EURO|nr:hypothetical protein EYZ11_003166 [Aspergillus tanneri]
MAKLWQSIESHDWETFREGRDADPGQILLEEGEPRSPLSSRMIPTFHEVEKSGEMNRIRGIVVRQRQYYSCVKTCKGGRNVPEEFMKQYSKEQPASEASRSRSSGV